MATEAPSGHERQKATNGEGVSRLGGPFPISADNVFSFHTLSLFLSPEMSRNPLEEA